MQDKHTQMHPRSMLSLEAHAVPLLNIEFSCSESVNVAADAGFKHEHDFCAARRPARTRGVLISENNIYRS